MEGLREMGELIVLKIGGSVITDKDKPFTLHQGNMERLSLEISRGYRRAGKRLILIHGAGSFGHSIVSKTQIHKGISKPEQILAFAETQRWQNHLNVLVTEALQRAGLPAIPCQASSFSIMDRGRLVWMPLDAVKGMLEVGLIPVLYGVPAYDMGQGCSILSGDQIAPYLAKELRAERIIHGTDVDGVYTDDPHLNPDAIFIPEIAEENIEEVMKSLRTSSHIDVTGGMLGKIQELWELAEIGIEPEIINANREGLVEKALSGERGLGTILRAKIQRDPYV
jgi:isopentenyl phosphate kinase